MENLRLHGGNLIIGNEIKKADLLIKDGKIEAIVDAETSTHDYKMHDCTGMNIAPGFVEIHSHGGGGSDYMDAEEDSYKNILNLHVQHGTTSVLATTMSASYKCTCDAIDSYLQAEKDKSLPINLLGMHVEGIFISPNQAGAQPPENIRPFNPTEYVSLYERSQGKIKRWSAAPELDGAKEFADFANKNGIVLSIGHSDADFDTVVKAFDWGFHHITHFYSGCSSVIRREGFRVAGVVEAGYYLDDMNVEIIADGCHLPQSLLKLIIKTKGIDHVALITDSMRAAGQTSGESYIGRKGEETPVVIEKGVAMMLSHDSFGGSIATSDRLIRTMLSCGVSLCDAVKMATITPLKTMNLNVKKGLLKEGYDADIVIFDNDINVKNVFVNGIKRV